MPNRTISWNRIDTARLDRVRFAPGVVGARTLIQGFARIRRTSLLTPEGAFSRTAVMLAAVEAAKRHQERTGCPWQAAMSIGLTAAWQAARAERRDRLH